MTFVERAPGDNLHRVPGETTSVLSGLEDNLLTKVRVRSHSFRGGLNALKI